MIAVILDITGATVGAALIAGFILFLVKILFRSTWAAIAALMLILAAIWIPGQSSLISSVLILLEFGIFIFVYFRFGLLTTAVNITFFVLLVFFPVTIQLSACYSGIGLTGLAILLAFAIYAFHTSLGGQPLFGRASLED